MLNELMMKMIEFDYGDPKRIQHFIKVHSFSKLIGEKEGLDAHTLFVLEAASILHDIGIRVSEEKYGFQNGKLQEQEGPAPAREICTSLGFKEDDIERICFLIAHHHTYTDVDGMDYRILLEADFLVNLYEDGAGKEAAKNAGERVFRTASGKAILHEMYDLTPEK